MEVASLASPLVGYVCSDPDWSFPGFRQWQALRSFGVPTESIWSDDLSVTGASHPGLDDCLAHLRPNDTLVLYDLRAVAGSLDDLEQFLEGLATRNAELRLAADPAANIDFLQGNGLVTALLALVRLQRAINSGRTKQGLHAARANGKVGGRPRKLTDDELRHAVQRLRNEKMALAEICMQLGINRTTLYRRLGTRRDFF
ncbi:MULTISPECIES: recombinase family protein [unclassified Chelatococcus]|uniref:recombinase family protein n=1 Tax=unclassified Chelatococcus TaxID=2638111 RepID=UPI001BCE5E94|nr:MULTISPECIES: recombinase family protein [unclassified Chelatococcus]MBS7700496.1 recombinase family protein [Chelatococcus sp. YT9]MBX3556292.1 recombinase family protein [Chelatococcus sp.]